MNLELTHVTDEEIAHFVKSLTRVAGARPVSIMISDNGNGPKMTAHTCPPEPETT
jgi:hypothetical protein